jgi:hypothetical protein
MSWQEGRIEKRIQAAVPLELSSSEDHASSESTVTENVCAHGTRVLTRRVRQPNERVMVRFLEGDVRTQGRVVYCQRLLDGRFGVGLQLQGVDVNFVSTVQRWSQNQT